MASARLTVSSSAAIRLPAVVSRTARRARASSAQSAQLSTLGRLEAVEEGLRAGCPLRQREEAFEVNRAGEHAGHGDPLLRYLERHQRVLRHR